MAPRASTKRKTSDIQEKAVKSRALSTTSTSTTVSRRASRPLGPSTSQNSVAKPAKATHKPRQQTLPKIGLVPFSPVRKQQKTTIAAPVEEAQQPLHVYVFGSGSMGELGLGPRENQRDVKRPRLNTNLLPKEIGVIDVAVGGMHCAAIDVHGRVWTWGVNDQGVLGRDTTWAPENEWMGGDDEDEETLNPRESVPGLVEGFPEGSVVTKIACGDSVTVATTNDGKVYAWGTFRVPPQPQQQYADLI
jgi:alpha-tubulin suppressor-like RCC1 family protein